jgi:hypothetical protein
LDSFFLDDLFFLRGKAMDMKTGGIAVGIRFKLNKLGRIRCPELAGKVGVVVDVSLRTTGVAKVSAARRKMEVTIFWLALREVLLALWVRRLVRYP